MNAQMTRGQILRLRDVAGNTVSASGGSVWITEENSPRDVVLKPGQSWPLTRPGLVIVEAFSEASITLTRK